MKRSLHQGPHHVSVDLAIDNATSHYTLSSVSLFLSFHFFLSSSCLTYYISLPHTSPNHKMDTPQGTVTKPDERKDADGAHTNGQVNGSQVNGASTNGNTNAAANGQTNGDSHAEGTYPKPLGSYPPTGIDVLIIGTGLAGLTCAIECTRKGHTVRVLERNSTINTAGKFLLS